MHTSTVKHLSVLGTINKCISPFCIKNIISNIFYSCCKKYIYTDQNNYTIFLV